MYYTIVIRTREPLPLPLPEGIRLEPGSDRQYLVWQAQSNRRDCVLAARYAYQDPRVEVAMVFAGRTIGHLVHQLGDL